MATYSDWQQRQMDIESGEKMDRVAATRRPGLGWTLSEETKKALKEIEDNARSARIAARNTFFD